MYPYVSIILSMLMRRLSNVSIMLSTRAACPIGQTLPNPDNTRPIVGRPTDLRVTTEPGRCWQSLVAQLALQYSAFNHCATREALCT